ncbi:predicted protein [Chaetomium globosum CBS 148.51]|uniref:Uncharacterized protein n=1 Tax=Chaetomium globosum (strain ATCC 6205 / CBS 148.51 / DSM 1962 / NBRC 6347 / NRRL 1970) TaxID=306901 RepID=Q2HDN1_CHAGB|nr:uncharacterized protein CHGG_01673 [Chaetomium globosum CBS 148.51]EAQ93438.1 predicted protein [Chaetomium globosum CBS 148.51]
MSTPTTEELRQLSEKAVEFTRPTTERRPSTFLSLAPTTSESYPRAPRVKQPLTAEALTQATQQQASEEELAKRRTSSLSSDASKFRFLKLGPVHWGEHQGESNGDFHEVAVE